MKSKITRKEKYLVLLTFIFIFTGMLAVFLLRRHVSVMKEEDRYYYIAMNESNHISTTVDCIMARTSALKALVIDHNGDIDFFDDVAAKIYDDVTNETGVPLKNIAIAPGGIVANVYPKEGNESFIGFDFFDSEKQGNAEALEAYRTGQTILTNPFELVQGGMGMAGRAPVNVDGEFWGLVTVTIDYEKLIDALKLDNMEGMGIAYELAYISDDDERVVIQSEGEMPELTVSYRFKIRNLLWEFSVAPKSGWAANRLNYIMPFIFLFFAIFAAKFVETLFKLRESNKNLKQMTDDALAASEAKSAFLSNVSHEIRTPINAVLGMNEMILRESEDKEVLYYSENIKKAGNTLLGLINNVLDISKIESGKTEIVNNDYDLASLLSDLANVINIRAEEKGLEIRYDFASDIPKSLNGDELHIKQIITNMLSNAVKYTDKGYVTFSVGFDRIEGDNENVMINVSVSDTGTGIKPEDIERLFGRYERINDVQNRNIEGSGLGMAISRNLLEMMGSKLEVASTYGEGSTFSFSIKQKVVKWDVLGNFDVSIRTVSENKKKYREKFTAPDARLLIVDDTRINVEVFKGLLKNTEVMIDAAESGDTAVNLAMKNRYDIIFLDHMMPGKDGIEVFHEIKAQKDGPNIDTPIIILTANAISGAREKYMAEGFNDYLSKPINPSKLEDMVLMYLPAGKVKLTGVGSVIVKGQPIKQVSVNTDKLDMLRNQTDLDISSGVYNCGTSSVYLSLAEIFYNDIDECADEADRLLESGDIKNYTIKVHGVKSASRTVGAMELGELAWELESAGKSGDIDYIKANHEEFIKRLRGYKEMLAPIFGEESK